MKKALAILLLLVVSSNTFAQKDSSYYNPNVARKLYYLKPLQKAGGVYFYGDRKLSGYNALEVPFFELNDAEVNHHYKKYKVFTGVGRAIGIIPTIYLLANPNNSRVRQSGYYTTTYLSIILTSLGGSITCNADDAFYCHCLCLHKRYTLYISNFVSLSNIFGSQN